MSIEIKTIGVKKFQEHPTVEVSETVLEDGSTRRRAIIHTVGKTKTCQEAAKFQDMNYIIKRHLASGVSPYQEIKNPGLYKDYSTENDYAQSLTTVIKAKQQFDGLSSQIRERFGNNPALMLKFMDSRDPNDIEESYKLGLRVRQPEQPVTKVEVINKEEK